MARIKGSKKEPGSGRAKGTPNKITAEMKAFLSAFIEENHEKMQELFDRVAQKDPKGALDLYLKAAQYVHPTKKAVDHQGQVGIQVVVDV